MHSGAPLRPQGWSSLAVVLASLSQGCSVDDRQLSRRFDTSLVSSSEDSGVLILPDSGGIGIKKSGPVNYVEDAGRPAAHDAAPPPPEVCLHIVDGAPDCDRTLATNADFNTDITGWAASGFAELRWVEKDSQNASGSGSIAVKNGTTANLDGLGEVAATQCFPVVPQRTYDYQASVYIKRGQVDYGQAQLGVWFYERAKCQGLVQAGGAYAVGSVQATNSWLPIVGSLAPVPSSLSMSVRLIVQKPYQSDPLEVLFDAVRITSRPSLQP
jgi:hypothetical protein